MDFGKSLQIKKTDLINVTLNILITNQLEIENEDVAWKVYADFRDSSSVGYSDQSQNRTDDPRITNAGEVYTIQY